jgi:P2 family phage contractile tail tube protein
MYCGSKPDDAFASNHLTLRSVQLPRLEMQYVDHRAGGAPVSIEIDVIQTRMECKFELIGITPQVMELMGRQVFLPFNNDYFIYGHTRNWLTGAPIKAEVFIRGQLGSIEPSEFKRGGEPFSIRYSIRGIVVYQFTLGTEPIYYWNFYRNIWAVGGYDQDGNQIQLPGSLAQNQ